ncbi:hypothetical protein B0T17DRAFT_593578 [Bombardia bombarda]|uniref:Protein SQS1 n=1 Tax=Bombardia bombarda TaxID=252184 RepID=A0AA39T117_9PEZI|nr:hypothetical protein B0T17DRAFT_593578 [Bombardia bombarda]
MAPRKGKRPPADPKPARIRSVGTPSRSRDFQPANMPGLDHNGFTMRDEARNTRSHMSTFGLDARLRQKPVSFVSAGLIEPLEDFKELKSPDPVAAVMEQSAALELLASEDLDPDHEMDVADEIDPSEDMDLVGDVDLPDKTDLQETLFVKEEVLVTEVSKTLELHNDIGSNPDAQDTTSCAAPQESFFFDVAGDKSIQKPSGPPPKIPPPRSYHGESDSSEDVVLFRGRSGNAPRNGQKAIPVVISSNGPNSRGQYGRQTHKPGNDSIVIRREDKDSPRAKQKHPRSQRGRIRAKTSPENDDEDDDDVEDAILADYIANMAADSEGDLPTPLILPFNSNRELGGDHGAFALDPAGEEGEDTTDTGSNDGNQDGVHEDDDLGDLEGTMDSDLDDETLAKLLGKQEELGIESEDLILFSDSVFKNGKGKKAARYAARHNTLDTTNSVADAFNDLDLAEWNQPPIRSRGRRSKLPPNFNVSDSELETALKTTWHRDRERKKNRKMEREQLRADGLLGRNVNPDDLCVKYREGMQLEDVKAELVTFLLGSAERLQFPPMNKQARKTLHELANKFKVKSQSAGNGNQRHPVLYRTQRTVRYAETSVREATSQVDEAAMRIGRKYFHRLDVKGRVLPKSTTVGRSSGHKAVTYREGEIVGASAPQLGQENRGHAMLEKMGWSKGMALGTLGNQGILEPVTQVIKRSKAGLG